MDTVHAVEMASSLDSETVCENPLCDVSFQQTGLAISPKRFCCEECKQQASIIKRAARLLSGLHDSRVLEILRTPCPKLNGSTSSRPFIIPICSGVYPPFIRCRLGPVG